MARQGSCGFEPRLPYVDAPAPLPEANQILVLDQLCDPEQYRSVPLWRRR